MVATYLLISLQVSSLFSARNSRSSTCIPRPSKQVSAKSASSFSQTQGNFQPNQPRLSAKLKATFSQTRLVFQPNSRRLSAKPVSSLSQTQGNFQPHLKTPFHRFSIAPSAPTRTNFLASKDASADVSIHISALLDMTKWAVSACKISQ